MLKKLLPAILVASLGFILNCGSKLDSGAISPISMVNLDSGLSSVILAPKITSISPNSGESTGAITTTITVTNFNAVATVRLTRLGHTDIPATVMSVVGNTIICSFNISGAAAGQWNVVVDNTDGSTITLPAGFRVYALPGGLTNWWPMDVNTDDAITVNGNLGTTYGGISFIPDRLTPPTATGAVSSDGADGSYVNSTSHGAPMLSNSRTMMGWVKIDSLNNNSIGNFLFGYGFAPSNLFTLTVSYMTGLAGRLVFDSGVDTLKGSTILQAGRWYHVAVSYDGGTVIKLYINGNLENTGSITALNTPGSMPMYFFQFGSNPARIKGALDDVRIYSGELPQSDIQTIAALNQYLIAPTGVLASKGTDPVNVQITWNPVLNASDYDIYRDTTLAFLAPVKLNAMPVTVNSYTDTTPLSETIYYYKVVARNAAATSDYSNAALGYAGVPLQTFFDGFETGIINPPWDGGLSPSGGTQGVIDTIHPRSLLRSLHVTGSTSYVSGSPYTYSISLTKTFVPAISYIDLSMWYERMYMDSSNIKLYINNTSPTDDLNWVPFNEPVVMGGWKKLTATYTGDFQSINSITILFLDVPNPGDYFIDDIMLIYR